MKRNKMNVPPQAPVPGAGRSLLPVTSFSVGPSQFLGQGLFAAPRQDARVLDGSFLVFLLSFGLSPFSYSDAPRSFSFLRLTLAAGRAPRQIHALLNWRRRFYFQSLRRRRCLPSR